MFSFARVLCSLAIIFTAIFLPAQTGFSGDIVDMEKPGFPTLAKIYFDQGKRRLEMQSASGDDSIILSLAHATATKRGTHMRIGGSGDAIILDLTSQNSIVLWPQQKAYNQSPLKRVTPIELYGLYAFVHPTDVENACAEWMKRAGAEGESCRKVGSETINGRSAVKYELSCYDQVCRLWIDRNLHVLVKRESKWNSTELRNIQEGPQPESLFEVPVGYSWKNPAGIIRPTEPN